MRGFDRVFALKSEIRVPLEHVTGAQSGEQDAAGWFHGIRAPGTSVPGVIVAGTFYWHGECAFYDVHHPDKAVAITVRDEKYRRLIVEVDDPAATIASVNAAVRRVAAGGHAGRPDATPVDDIDATTDRA